METSYSNYLQLGLKKNSSYDDALFAFNETVRYCTYNNINYKGILCFLDASKAFDKVLHNGLFVKMLRRDMPVSSLYG